MQATIDKEQGEPGWEQLALVLDEALTRLTEKDRDAIVLRYLEGRAVPEVAAALGVNETAVRKRVERAVDKLQRFFVKRGIKISGGVLMGRFQPIRCKPFPPVWRRRWHPRLF